MYRRISDPTANTAIGSVDRQLRAMEKEANLIGKLYRSGKLSYEQLLTERRRFTGIFRRLLERALAEDDE